MNPALSFGTSTRTGLDRRKWLHLHFIPGHAVDDDDDDQTFISEKQGTLQVFRMAHHVRAATECNTMIQPLSLIHI